MRILAFDPGPHTGIAEYTVERDGETTVRAEQVEGDFQTLAWRIHSYIDGGADVIVCEDFFIGGQRGRESNLTIELIGAVKTMAMFLDSEDPPVPVVMQKPGDASSFVTGQKLKAMGWKPVGSHATSATKHLLLYLIRAGIVSAENVIQ